MFGLLRSIDMGDGVGNAISFLIVFQLDKSPTTNESHLRRKNIYRQVSEAKSDRVGALGLRQACAPVFQDHY